jgi:3-methyladenine DNA glycosylase AlkD
MPELQLHNKSIETIFQLLGESENAITYSVGWALYRSPAFLREFLEAAIVHYDKKREVALRLQDYRKKTRNH